MKAWFDDVEIGSSIFFIIHPVERMTGSAGPPLGLTYTFNGGRQVPLKLDRVEDGQAYYKVFEVEKEKREEMGRPKGSTNKSKDDSKHLRAVHVVGVTIPPVVDDKVIPVGTTCQEASPFGKGEYVPCGEPAVAIVFHAKDKRSYYMCHPCADHNVRNRGGVYKIEPKVPVGVSVPMGIPPAKSEPPKYVSIETGEELWELDFPDKPELFRQLIQQRIDLKYEVDAMEERIKEINGSILPFFERNGIPGVQLEGGYLVRKHEGQSVTLNKEALVLAGVPAETIEKCTVRKRYTTIMVKGPKG